MGGSSSKFNSSTTALEALDGADLTGRVVVVTGGNAGIGRETVKALSSAKATVVIACRSMSRGETAKSEILTELDRKEDDAACPILVLPLDLGDLQSVSQFPEKFNELNLPLNYLVCNAGVFPSEFKTTTQGYEQMFGVNHLGHFYLIQLLLPKLRASGSSRVVMMSSSMRVGAEFIEGRFAMGEDVVGPREDEFNSSNNYSLSKLCNELTAREVNRRYFESGGVMGVSARPGLTVTSMTQSGPFIVRVIIGLVGWMVAKTTEQGAATTVRCVVMPDEEIEAGGFYADCQREESDMLVGTGPAEESHQYKLWELSMKCLEKSGFGLSGN